MKSFSIEGSGFRRTLSLFIFTLVCSSSILFAAQNQEKARSGLPVALSPVVIQAGAPILVAADAPLPVRLAIKNLQRDLKSVLGVASPLVNRADQMVGLSGLVIVGPETKWAGASDVRNSRITGWEAHGIFVRELNGTPQVVLQGADLRGTLYALYPFSEKFGGVPPLG